MLWAGLFINVASQSDELSMLAAIANESTHRLLFSFTVDAPNGLNDAGQRYASPLCDDPRPMGSIFYTALVRSRRGTR